MRRLLNFWSNLGNLFEYMMDIVLLSLCWLLCSIPLFTVGAATTALYDATIHTFRFGEGGTYARFFGTFKREFKLATLSWLMWMVIWATGFYILRFAAGINPMFLLAGLILMLLPTGMMCWVFPVLSRFTYNFPSLNKTAVAFAGIRILSSVLIAVSTVMTVYICAWLWLPALFMPALLMLFWSIFMEKTFMQYMPGENEE